MNNLLLRESQVWLETFRAKFGRAPRILHIGNIANNAYNNARLLNEAGLDCDVICYDYYHVMGCPEWEDADCSGEFGDQFRPDWAAARISRFERPRWFAQGPLLECINYLVARREGNLLKAEELWGGLCYENGLRSRPVFWKSFLIRFRRLRRAFQLFAYEKALSTRIAKYVDSGPFSTKPEVLRLALTLVLILAAVVVRFGKAVTNRLLRGSDGSDDQFDAAYSFQTTTASLKGIFKAAFPARSDALRDSDMAGYQSAIFHWKRLFDHYDLVQAYSTDPILPMLAAKKPYIGFEHGTLRSHTQCDAPICRLTSLAYNMADHVFITNGDCLDYARKIGVIRFTPMLHPVDERRAAQIEGRYDELRLELGVRYVFLCTLRHDWAIKGTDQYIRALPELTKSLGRDFRVIMTRWGAELDKSIALAESLGVADLIVWSTPLSRRKLIKTLKSVDILFDQIALPHFGATAPEGIAVGIPVIMSYEPSSTEWLVAEPAPILTAHNAVEIAAQVLRALDSAWLADYRQRAAKWFDAHHSSRLVVQGHMDIYRRLIPTI